MTDTSVGTFCKHCLSQVEDVVVAMRYGCQKCGGRKFGSRASQQAKKNITEDAAIRIQSNGKFIINIQALTDRTSNIEPVIIEDRRGIVNIVLDPDE
ncbi:MAG: hypothetical protein ACXAD7_17700 [Candidatus Kariarchaeaceae archaeon]